MLESIKGLSGWCCKDYKMTYEIWRQGIVKQNESNGDLKFITIIGLGGKLASYWKINRRQSWKWKGECKLTKTPY
jgi:hypothetical protein